MSEIEVVVVGSINVDRAVDIPHALEQGATVLGGDVLRGPGGKGANQAVAAARLGRRVAMVGAVGEDGDGEWMLDALRSEGIDTGGVALARVPTGQAFVFVEPDGESTIVVSPGANGALSGVHVDASARSVGSARCVLVQQEVPGEVVARAAALCRGIFILNPAPAREVDPEVLEAVDVLVPNRFELARIAGVEVPRSVDEVVRVARLVDGPAAIVVTLGADGAVVIEGDAVKHVAAARVDAVDATAAGDTFCGALVDGLLGGSSLVDAVKWANTVAAKTVARRGAQESIPYRSEIE